MNGPIQNISASFNPGLWLIVIGSVIVLAIAYREGRKQRKKAEELRERRNDKNDQEWL